VPELRKISGEKAIHVLTKLGFERIRQRGDHVILKRRMPEGEVGCVVPLHRELKIGTLRGILKTSKSESRGIYKPPLGSLT
jgi:predicted RNA binding protein YcfA (HicA-like mRNA interferase family)